MDLVVLELQCELYSLYDKANRYRDESSVDLESTDFWVSDLEELEERELERWQSSEESEMGEPERTGG